MDAQIEIVRQKPTKKRKTEKFTKFQDILTVSNTAVTCTRYRYEGVYPRCRTDIFICSSLYRLEIHYRFVLLFFRSADGQILRFLQEQKERVEEESVCGG